MVIPNPRLAKGGERHSLNANAIYHGESSVLIVSRVFMHVVSPLVLGDGGRGSP